jgi:hypothetical protein
MMASATLFGFFGVLLAVPIGAVLKILLHHASRAYLASRFYQEPAAIIAGARDDQNAGRAPPAPLPVEAKP